MSSTAPIPLDYQLPAEAYYHLVRSLRLTLPPPPGLDPGATGSAEDLLRRDHAAIAGVVGLAPANAVEADVAAQFVAASAQWKHCLRVAQLPGTTPESAQKCRAQAAGMMRQANSALRLLLQTQAARRKLEADSAARDRAAWTEHVATRLMAEALSDHPHPDPLPAGEGEGATPPLPLGEGRGEGQAAPAAPHEAAVPPPPSRPESKPEPVAAPADPACLDPDSLGAAEEYAIIYPERAALIRRLGRLPDDTSFGPPDDDVVHALVTAHTPVLAALDGFPIREAHRVPDHAFPEPCPVRACPGEGRGHGARAA